MNENEAIMFVESIPFREAKSYSMTYPHWYTTRSMVNDDVNFDRFLRYVRDNAILKAFHSKQYLYLELGSFEYWEMGRPIPAVQVLNKAIIDDAKGYRHPKPTIEMRNELLRKLNEREHYLAELLAKEYRTDNEEKTIRFLMDNRRRIDGGGKNIIDHYTQPVRYE